MNKKSMMIMLVVALVAISAYFFVRSFLKISTKSPISRTKETKNPEKSPLEVLEEKYNVDVQKLTTPEIRALGTLEILEKSSDGCKNTADASIKAACDASSILKEAYGKQDAALCQKIDDKIYPVASCERNIVLKSSVAKNDINLCGTFKDERTQSYCRDNFLFEKEYKTTKANFDCNLFSDGAAKNDCIKYKNNPGKTDSGYCDSLESALFKIYCFDNNMPSQASSGVNK